MMTEADIGMTEHRSKNTLGRSVPIKTKTDVEEDGTSEDGYPRPDCIYYVKIIMKCPTHEAMFYVKRLVLKG